MREAVAIVTGGAGGLGREIVSALAQSGCRVCVNYFGSREAAEEIVAKIGEDAIAVRTDVGDFHQVSAMCGQVFHRWGRIDIVINNAGVTKDSLFIKQREEDWDRIMSVNLKGPFNVIRACVPLMTRGGHIVNISSYSGLKGRAGQAAYSASKAALLGLTKTAAIELAGAGIKVNAVLPGYMQTSMGMAEASSLDAAKQDSMLHTLSDPRDVAQFIAYIATVNGVTGQAFILDSRIV
ncbi:MAG TPA: SDR family NAD(P)-dependent oxidoreductase [Dissulfurispiraceae bacterium]|nr:SDR family NAD(P)-dependent oxidoreductase [Dissulfurispiraceae bacterium]